MFPLNIFLNRYEENHFTEEDIEKLKIPSGVDKFAYEIKANKYYYDILEKLKKVIKLNLFSSKYNDKYCFYCGSQADIIEPAFFHNGSGINLWMYTDWRCATILCKTCSISAGKSTVTYKKKFNEISRHQPNKLLEFEPDILLPSLEPALEHFEYSTDGILKAITLRGQTTIHRFSLNRKDLVHCRKEDIFKYGTEVFNTKKKFPLLKNLQDLDSNLASLKVLFCSTENMEYKLANKNFELLTRYLHEQSPLYASVDEIEQLLAIKYKETTYKKINDNRTRTQYAYENFPGLKSIKFSGIRGFEDSQSINFEGRNSLLLIGENGVGKSTLLELIKRAVKPYTKLILSDLINIKNINANINVEYNNVRARKLIFSDEEGYVQGKRQLCNVIEISELRILDSQMKKLVTWVSMVHDETNSTSLNNSLSDWVERQLKILLLLPPESVLNVENGNVFWLKDRNSIHRDYLENFSSGYKSIMTIFHLIVSKFIKTNDDNSYNILKEGLSNTIVLIDEIELHLHPVFKKSIIEILQKVFPEVLFIMTTHDPLVLKSAGLNTKVILLSKHENKTIIDEDLPNPQYMSTGQILTSPIFGLSTIESSTETQSNLDAYYKALENKNWSEADLLREKLADSGLFGQTYRELIALSAVDAYLVKKEIPKIDTIIKFLEESDA